MNRIAVRIITLFLLFVVSGCAAGIQPVCRHTAFMCALVMQERYEQVEVAFGPSLTRDMQPDPLTTHAQTRVMVDGQWVWVNYADERCQLTDRKERFVDLNHYPAHLYYERSWKSPAAVLVAAFPQGDFREGGRSRESGVVAPW